MRAAQPSRGLSLREAALLSVGASSIDQHLLLKGFGGSSCSSPSSAFLFAESFQAPVGLLSSHLIGSGWCPASQSQDSSSIQLPHQALTECLPLRVDTSKRDSITHRVLGWWADVEQSLSVSVTGIVSRHSMFTSSEPCLGRTDSSFLARRYTRGVLSCKPLLLSYMCLSSAGLLSLDLEGRLGVSGCLRMKQTCSHWRCVSLLILSSHPRCCWRGLGGLLPVPWSGKSLRYVHTIPWA